MHNLLIFFKHLRNEGGKHLDLNIVFKIMLNLNSGIDVKTAIKKELKEDNINSIDNVSLTENLN